jgi:phytoene desaturase
MTVHGGVTGALSGVRAVVVGAGFGGLAAAAHLSQRGVRVTVLDQASHVGGKARPLTDGGFVFDTGPTLLTMRDLVEEAFRAAGADAPPLTELDPICHYVFPSGRQFSIHRDAARTEREVDAACPEDRGKWRSFLDECHRIHALAGAPYLDAPYEGVASGVRGFAPSVVAERETALRLRMGLTTLSDLAARWFQSSELRALVGRFATYAGASPFRASSAFAMIPHLELTDGAFYPAGGMQAMAERLADALRLRGVAFELGVRAERIEVAAGSAIGVRAVAREGGVCFHPADVVVCDVDPLTVARTLVPHGMATIPPGLGDRIRGRSARGFLEREERRERSISGFAWVFGVRPPSTSTAPSAVPLAHHTISFGSGPYAAEFEAIFREGTVVEDPTVYVSVPTVSDPSRAPLGHHAVFTLVNAPALPRPGADRSAQAVAAKAASDARLWEARTPVVRARILRKLTALFGHDVESRICAEHFVTPVDLQTTGGAEGSIYGSAPHGAFGPFQRPRNRANFLPGLYFAGGGTHPGGGVPLVLRSGRFVADLVEADVRAGSVARTHGEPVERLRETPW